MMASFTLPFYILFVIGKIRTQDNCDKCSYEGHCFNRLVDMQLEIRELQDDLKSMRTQMEAHGEVLSNVTKLSSTDSMPLVAFSAYAPTDSTPENGRIVVFSRVSLNLGGGYDPLFGIFTVPVKGLYHFTAHFCNMREKVMVFAIFLDARELAVSAASSQHSTCSSLSEITIANRGQKVTVQGRYDYSVLQEDIHRKAHFIGLLIHAI